MRWLLCTLLLTLLLSIQTARADEVLVGYSDDETILYTDLPNNPIAIPDHNGGGHPERETESKSLLQKFDAFISDAWNYGKAKPIIIGEIAASALLIVMIIYGYNRFLHHRTG